MSNLPKITDLYEDKAIAVQKNNLNSLLNEEPLPSWLVKHPFIKKESKDANGQILKVPIDYMPIARVEWLLTSIFQEWNVEIKTIQQIANSIVVTIRLHYTDPVTGNSRYHDGVGAVAIQTEQGASATDFSKVRSDAVMKATPAAKSYALKDAADHLGKLFGKDLNRAQIISYANLQGSNDHLLSISLKNQLSELLNSITDEKSKAKYIDEINEAEAVQLNTSDFYTRIINELETIK